MKNLIVTIVLACLSFNANSTTIIFEDVVKKSEVITTKIGSYGKPLIGAAVGVGFGSDLDLEVTKMLQKSQVHY